MSIIENFTDSIKSAFDKSKQEIKSNVKEGVLQVKAESIRKTLATVTGFEPVIVYQDNKAFIMWKKEDIPALQRKLNSVLSVKRKPSQSDTVIKFEPVLYPVIIKKILPYAVALGAAGFILGRVIK